MFPSPGQYAREANAKVDAVADDARFTRMNALDLLWNGRAYTGRPSFWDSSVPLRDRQPALQVMLARTVGRRLVAMTFGERTAPTVTVERTSFGVELSDAEAELLGALVRDVIEVGAIVPRLRALMESGLKSGSACAIVGIVGGKPRVCIEPAKHCYPTLDASGVVTRLVITYRVPMGEAMGWYRREIGDGVDREYEVQPCDDREMPDWSRAKVKTESAIPFVPVVWVRNLAEAEEETRGVDGHALVEGLEAESWALDMNVSMLFRNALYNTDPQLVRIGVDGGSGLGAPAGQQASTGFLADAAEWARGWFSRLSGGGTAAKRGPGQLWNLPMGADAKMIESTGAGSEIALRSINEIRRVLTDALGVVLADPQVIARGDLSGKALEILLGPMIDTVGVLRVEYGAALIAIIDMALRMCADPVIGRGVYLATLAAAMPVLARLTAERTVSQGEGTERVWVGAPLSLRWPDVVTPSWADISAAIDAATKATGGRAVLSQRAGLRLVAPVAGVEDLDAEAEAIDREGGADAEAMRATIAGLSPKDDAAVPVAPEASVQDTALNGAQVDALVALAEKVTARAIPLETAVRIAVRAFQLSDEEARDMLAPAASAPAPVAEVKP